MKDDTTDDDADAPTTANEHDRTDEDRGILQSVRFGDALIREGYDDPMVLTWESAKQVMTQKRLELLEAIGSAEASFASHRELARHLDRDIAQVQRDLDTLYEIGVLEREEGLGTASTPVLSAGTLVVSPLMVDGERLPTVVNFTAYTDDTDEGDDGETDFVNDYGTHLETDLHCYRGVVVHPPDSDRPEIALDMDSIERASPAPASLQTHLGELFGDPSVDVTAYVPGEHETPLSGVFEGQSYVLVVLSTPTEIDDEATAPERLESATETLGSALEATGAGRFDPTAFAQRQRLIAPLIDEIPPSALERL